ncbi:MAG: TetR/AcrR family transcriptional regulator [Thermoplasmata archaeon]
MRVPKTNRGIKTKNKLLKAAERVFGEKGYFDSSISEITRKAKVSTGTFYIYYNSKIEIFKDLIVNLNHELRKVISISVSDLTKRKDIEEMGFKKFFEFLKRHKKLYRIVRQAEYIDPALFSWYYKKIAEGYSKGLDKAMENKEFKKGNSELLSFALMGIADFVGMRYVLWEDEINDDIIRELMDFIFNGILDKTSKD